MSEEVYETRLRDVPHAMNCITGRSAPCEEAYWGVREDADGELWIYNRAMANPVCPITGERLRDAFMCMQSGITYEWAVIRKHVESAEHPVREPFTGVSYDSLSFVRNIDVCADGNLPPEHMELRPRPPDIRGRCFQLGRLQRDTVTHVAHAVLCGTDSLAVCQLWMMRDLEGLEEGTYGLEAVLGGYAESAWRPQSQAGSLLTHLDLRRARPFIGIRVTDDADREHTTLLNVDLSGTTWVDCTLPFDSMIACDVRGARFERCRPHPRGCATLLQTDFTCASFVDCEPFGNARRMRDLGATGGDVVFTAKVSI